MFGSRIPRTSKDDAISRNVPPCLLDNQQETRREPRGTLQGLVYTFPCATAIKMLIPLRAARVESKRPDIHVSVRPSFSSKSSVQRKHRRLTTTRSRTSTNGVRSLPSQNTRIMLIGDRVQSLRLRVRVLGVSLCLILIGKSKVWEAQ